MKLSRNVGVASQILQLFVQDATVSTGAGLANVVGSSVSYTWWHDTQAGASTGTASTAGTMGTYSTSAWVQISSANALGWYQFGAPNGVFAAGNTANLHFYGAPNMAPLPVEIDLNSQVNVTEIQGSNAVTSSAGVLIVSTQTIDKTGYSIVGTTFANIVQVYAQPAVTSGAGILNVSTQTIDKTGYSLGGTTMANVVQIYSQPAVTSASGILNVSTQTLAAGADNTGIANASSAAVAASTALYAPLAESYRGNASTGTMAQLMYEMVAHMGEAAIVVTTKTINTIGHTSAAMTFQLNSSTAPTSVTRIT